MLTMEQCLVADWGEDWKKWLEGSAPCFNMNDAFWWGCGDAECFTEEDLPDITQAAEECGGDISLGGLLWTSRKRELRPQGAYFTFIPKHLWPLFEAAGPYRTPDDGDPYAIGAYHPEKIKD